MNRLAILNDLLFYVVLVLALGCSSVTTADISEKKILGWAFIVTVTLCVHLNIVTSVAQAIKHIKLLYQRRQNIKMMKDKKAAVPEQKAAQQKYLESENNAAANVTVPLAAIAKSASDKASPKNFDSYTWLNRWRKGL